MLKNEHDIRLYGTSGIHIPILNNNTSARLTMSLHQKVQQPLIFKPELPILDTGYATQLSKFSYDVVVENESLFIKTIRRYGVRSDSSDINDWLSLIVVVYDIVENRLTHYEVNKYKILANKFGYRFNINFDYINNLEMKDVIPAGTKLAVSDTNTEGVHKTGRNLNVINCSLPESGEDCILLSESVLDYFTINVYDQYDTSYGKEHILANSRGDAEVYKAFPDRGDWVNAGEVVFSRIPLDLKALKKADYNYINNAIAYTDRGLRTRRAHFTDHTLARYSGRVVDVGVHYNAKTGDTVENDEITKQTTDYLLSLKTYHTEIYEMYKYFQRNYPNGDIDDGTNKLIVDSMVFLETPIRGKAPMVSRKIKKTKLDMYTIRVTVESPIRPNTGFKFSTRYASKGVIKVVPKEDMPRDANGVIADMAIMSKGIVARTNLGLPAEQYINASSRQTRNVIRKMLKVSNSAEIGTLAEFEINTVYDYLLEYLSHFNTVQYKIYSGKWSGNTFDLDRDMYINRVISLDERIEILKEIYDKELYIVYNINEKDSVFDITCRLEESKFKLDIVDVYIKNPLTNNFEVLKSRAYIAPLYTVMLNKITDNFLGADSFFLNGYGLPTGKSKEDHRYPYKYKNVKQWGESEFRLVAGYGRPGMIQLLKDRSSSIVNHKQFQLNQLISRGVTSQNLIPNRVEDSDIATNIIRAVLEPAGVTIGRAV